MIAVWIGGYKTVYENDEDNKWAFEVVQDGILVITSNDVIKTVYKEWTSASVI